MLIDWFTVGAQALNFVVLVWLLKRFLYKPILHAIDAREERISAELASAEEKMTEAQKERETFTHKNEEFDRQRTALFEKATKEAAAERQRLLGEARQAIDAFSAKRHKALRSDANQLNESIRRRTQEGVFAIARKALGDLASTSLERSLTELFIRRLSEIDGRTKDAIRSALIKSKTPATVRSALELPMEQRASIQNAINKMFSSEIELKFQTAPELIGGIEFRTNDQKVAWSIEAYLASMEKSLGDVLQTRTQVTSAPADENSRPETMSA